jgi:ABC-2 type transport system permease protein
MSDVRATLVVARRELLERVRSKWFAIVTLLGPIGIVAMIVVPALLAASGTAGTKVEIVDRTGVLGPRIAEALAAEEWQARLVDPETPEAELLAKIRRDEINGYLSIAPDALAAGPIIYQGDNASSQAVQLVLVKAVNVVVTRERGKREGLEDGQLATLLRPVNFASRLNTGEGEGTSGTGAFLLAYFLAFILYMVITLYGVAVLRSVVTEKSNRVMELMVAAVKPRSLMAGKILGVGGAGLLQVGVWLALGALALEHRASLLGWFGVDGAGGALPDFALVEVVVALAFFVLGFFFYAGLYAAVGAMVSSDQDAQQVQMPVTMLLVVGVLCLQVVSNAPRGSSSIVMSNVPFWSPMLMPMRFVLGGATLGEVVVAAAILIVSTLLALRAAAKIYRVGVLMYGKRPGLRELVRWLRH